MSPNLAQECFLSVFLCANESTCSPSCVPLSGCSNGAQHKMERACQRHHQWKESLYIWKFNRVPVKISTTLPVSQKSFKWYHLRQIIWFCAAASGATEPFFHICSGTPPTAPNSLNKLHTLFKLNWVELAIRIADATACSGSGLASAHTEHWIPLLFLDYHKIIIINGAKSLTPISNEYHVK